jgi:AraC family transcriptional activator FtrA
MIQDMRTVVVLAYDGAPTFELSIPGEVFGAAELAGSYRVVTVAGEPGTLRTEHNWLVAARRQAVGLREGDLLVVPGWREVEDPPAPRMLKLVQRAAAQGARVASLCTGAFVLAASGLLDGRRATTHWKYANHLAARYPEIEVNPSALYIDDGRVLTSAGSAAGIDLCLAIVRQDLGATLANAVARHLVVAAHRDGGQAQFIARPVPDARADDPIASSMSQMLADLAAPTSIAELAAACHLSPRQYLRRFTDATGTSPYQWLLGQRVARCQELLETSTLTIDQITHACGFGDPTALRAHFRRRVGLAPTQYRARFGAAPA